jgi:hypothetical protein
VRQLEVVAVSDDGSYVLLAADENAARATHAVRIDNRLHAAVRGELGDSDERRESELSPRDIQARLRAGESTEDVAKVAKVPVARVMRYAGPVLSERERIVQQAQTAVLQRSRGPELTTPLGQVVEKRLAETAGLRTDTIVWDARRRDDGAWVVVLSYSARGGARTASWLWQPAERELTSLNNLATRLGAGDAPGGTRRKRPPRPASRPARRTATKRTPRKRPAAKRTAGKRAATKRAATKRTAVKRTAAKRTAATKPAVKKRTARPTTKRTAKSAAPAAKRAVKRPTKPRPTPKPRRAPRVSEPPLIEPAVRRKNGRVEVPSWSDVLLGVQAPAATRGRRRS